MEESKTNLWKAFIEFQKEFKGLRPDGKNPFFKSNYITLDGILETVRPILSKNGLAVIQEATTNEVGNITVKTMLVHESGECYSTDKLTMIPQKINDPQCLGSLITYAKRYQLGALLGICESVDDDANGATFGKDGKPQSNPSKPQQRPNNNNTTPSGNSVPNNISITLDEAANTIMPAGKFANRTLGEILAENKGYITFVANTSKDAKLKAAAIKLLEENK